MGVDLYWRPKKRAVVFQKCNGSSQAIKVKEQFGSIVTSDDIQKLRHFYEATEEEIYKEMAEVIEKHGEIFISVE